MAQQLEAALRRMPENRPPVTDPLAGKTSAQPRSAEPRVPLRDFKTRVEPKFDSQPDTKPEPHPEPKPEPKLDSPPTPGKNLYDNLEQEMASLLGRPSGKT